MKTIEKRDDLNDGDLVEYDLKLYKAERRNKTIPCLTECDMKGMPGRTYCTGFCFRFRNGGCYVFKEVKAPKGDYTVIEIKRGIKDKI